MLIALYVGEKSDPGYKVSKAGDSNKGRHSENLEKYFVVGQRKNTMEENVKFWL